MAVGSGLGASLGFGKETTYNTYVAPSVSFCEFTSEDIKKVKNTAQGGGIAAGRLVQTGTRRIVTNTSGAGSVNMDVPNKKFGILLQQLMGTSVTPVQQGATTAYLQTHALADNFGKSLTAQVGIPQTDGVVKPYTYTGGKITQAEFSCGLNEFLSGKIDFDFAGVTEAQTLVTPAYPSGVGNWSFKDMTVKLGTYGSEAAVSGVTKMTLNIERAMKTDRFYAGSAGTKAEPILNDYQKVSGTIEADFLDKTVFADLFSADTSTSLVWTFQGPLIASTYYYTITFTVPMIFFDGDSPTVSGPDVVSGSFPFVGLSDGTNPICTIAYTSTDTTIA
jgi:hypothetical protein